MRWYVRIPLRLLFMSLMMGLLWAATWCFNVDLTFPGGDSPGAVRILAGVMLMGVFWVIAYGTQSSRWTGGRSL